MTQYLGSWKDYVRNGGRLHAYGTAAGVRKSWAKRGRSKVQQPKAEDRKSIARRAKRRAGILLPNLKMGVMSR